MKKKEETRRRKEVSCRMRCTSKTRAETRLLPQARVGRHPKPLASAPIEMQDVHRSWNKGVWAVRGSVGIALKQAATWRRVGGYFASRMVSPLTRSQTHRSSTIQQALHVSLLMRVKLMGLVNGPITHMLLQMPRAIKRARVSEAPPETRCDTRTARGRHSTRHATITLN